MKKVEFTKVITEEEYANLPYYMRGEYHDYYGTNPDLNGRRTAAFPLELPGLFVEGVNLKII